MHEEQNNVSCSLGGGALVGFLPLCAAGTNLDDSVTARQANAHCRRTAPSIVGRPGMETKEEQGFLNQRRREHDQKRALQ